MKSNLSNWILAGVAALIAGALVFLSLNFSQYESMGLNVVLSLVVVLVLLLMTLLATYLKKVYVLLNFKKYAAFEFLTLLVFIAIVFISMFEANHFFAVMGHQDKIHEDVEKQIGEMDKMYKTYTEYVDSRVKAYDGYLKELERGDHNSSAYQESGLDSITRENLLLNLRSDLDLGDDYKNKIDEWKDEMSQKSQGLNIITIMPLVSSIGQTLTETRDEIKKRSKSTDKGDNGDAWSYDLNVNNSIMNYFTKSAEEPFVLWSLFVLLLGVLMLLPYFATERDGRSKGLFGEMFYKRNNDVLEI